MTFHLLYIDPGTGSALFSVAIGIMAAVYFVFWALYLKLKIFFIGKPKQHGSYDKYVIYAEDKRYWTLFKPIVEEFEKRAVPLLYLTSSHDDPVFSADFQYIKAECLGESNKAFARLNFLSADFVLSTTPSLNVYQWKRSKKVNHYGLIRHSADEPVKFELFGMDYFDSILVSGVGFQEKDIRKLEKARNLPEKQVVTVGCPYLDEFAEMIGRIPKEENHVFTVLVSPSWGQSALLARFGERLLEPLVKTGWRIIVRPHPQSLMVEKEMLDRLYKKFEQNSNLEWDFELDNIFSLSKADVMISDFSGIILDFMFLRNKPVIYVSEKLDWRSRDAFEIYENQEEMWTFQKLKNAGIELKPELFDDLPDIVLKASADAALCSAIDEVKAEAWHYRGEAGKQTADFMIETVSRM